MIWFRYQEEPRNSSKRGGRTKTGAIGIDRPPLFKKKLNLGGDWNRLPPIVNWRNRQLTQSSIDDCVNLKLTQSSIDDCVNLKLTIASVENWRNRQLTISSIELITAHTRPLGAHPSEVSILDASSDDIGDRWQDLACAMPPALPMPGPLLCWIQDPWSPNKTH